MDRSSTGQSGGSDGKWRLKPMWLVLLAGWALALFLLVHPNGGLPAAAPGLNSTPAPATRTTPLVAPDIAMTTTAVVDGPRFRVAVWADALGRWQFGDLHPEASGYREGQAIPFLLRIDGLRPGDVYRVGLRYGCGTDGIAAFDFLTGYEGDAGGELTVAEEGPGRVIPDASVTVPDDPSIGFDDDSPEADRLFRLWGASLDGGVIGPLPDALCSETKALGLIVKAQAQTLYLLWAGHLGSSEDWGDGQGAAAHDSPLEMEIRIPGVSPESQELEIALGAVSP